MSLSDKKKSPEEEWQQMDVGGLRKFVREDIPDRSLAAQKDANFSTMYTRETKPRDSFLSFMDLAKEPSPPARIQEKPSPAPGEGFSASAFNRAPGSQTPPPRPEHRVAQGEGNGLPELEKEREQAREAGFTEGLVQGRSQGQGEGYAAGYAEGLASGREEGLAQGAAEGYDRGYEEGKAAGAGELSAQAEELALLVQTMGQQWPAILSRYEREIVALSLDIAETLVFGTLAVDTAVVERAVISALNRLPDPLKVTVSVNPEDYPQVEMARERFFEQVPDLRQLEVAADPGISRGGCRISSASGSIREDLKERMKVLKETLLLAADSRGG